MGNTPQPEICPIANVCAATTEYAPPCGEDRMHFPPLVTAEEMCPRALARGVRIELTKADDPELVGQKTERLTTAAWHTFEYGQTLPDPQAGAEHTEKAIEYAGEALRNRYGWFHEAIPAAMLNIYAPSLVKLHQGVELTQGEIATIQHGLGIVFDSLVSAPVHVPSVRHIIATANSGQKHEPCFAEEGQRAGSAIPLVGMMLALRQGIFLYPSSTREMRGSGVYRRQNHDAFAATSAGKLPIKMGSKSQLAAGARRGDTGGYDPKLTYINIRSLIGLAAEDLRINDRILHSKLLHAYDGTPNVLDIGNLLRDELNGVQLAEPARIFLDMVGRSMGARLTTDIDNFEANQPWQILPPRLAKRPFTEAPASPSQHGLATTAVHAYLQNGNKAYHNTERLERLIGEMREVQDPYIMSICSGAYIDLARQQSNPMRARQILEAAESFTASFLEKKWDELVPENAEYLYRIGLQNAYIPKLKKILSGETPGIADEMELYQKLLACGERSLEPASQYGRPGYEDIRGLQFKLSMHILNARRNLKHGKIIQSMWPSLPREADPYDNKFDSRSGWDAGISRGATCDSEQTRRLKFRGVGDSMIYDPEITVILGREHLTTQDTAEVIRLALREKTNTRNPARQREASTRLNEIEGKFFRRLSATSQN